MKTSHVLKKQTTLLATVVSLTAWRETCKTRFTRQRETGVWTGKTRTVDLLCMWGEPIKPKLVDWRLTWHKSALYHPITREIATAGPTTFQVALQALHNTTTTHATPAPPLFFSSHFGFDQVSLNLRCSNREPDRQTDIRDSIKNLIFFFKFWLIMFSKE